MTTESKTPSWLRPCAASIVPPRRWAAREEPPQAPATPAPAAPFSLPAGVERIVVLSNVVRGFPWHAVQLKSTDLVIHCGYARHREAAMRVQGTRHWLFVRHGRGRDPRGWHWYHPQNMDGFEKVFFVDDTQLLTPCRWMADYRRLTRKSPTTGFAVANLMREFAPHLPLLLAGFDPGEDHGTPQWEGHDWAAEREWYKQRGFVLLKPHAHLKLALLVCSCAQPQYKALRQACRDTWLSMLPQGVEYRFFVGADAPLPDEPDVICLPGVADTWDGLPAKIVAAVDWMYNNMSFEFLGKVDDDTYLRVDRLLPLLVPGVHLLGSFRSPRLGCWGGAGYFMSSEAAAKLLAHKGEIPAKGYEDVLVTRKIMQLGYSVTHCPRLKQNSHKGDGQPENGNDIISGHQFKRPEMHYACHKFNTHHEKQK